MTLWHWAVIVLAALLCYGAHRYLSRAKPQMQDDFPFVAVSPLSEPELVLFDRLKTALPDHMILAQVQLSRVIRVRPGRSERWLNRINRMSLDFLVCRGDSSVLAAIELDDGSHARPDRQVADAKKNKALAAAGLHLFRWRVRDIPGVDEIRKQVLGELPKPRWNPPAARSLASTPRPRPKPPSPDVPKAVESSEGYMPAASVSTFAGTSRLIAVHSDGSEYEAVFPSLAEADAAKAMALDVSLLGFSTAHVVAAPRAAVTYASAQAWLEARQRPSPF